MRAFFLGILMESWSSFWQQGHSTTFGPFFGGGYDGAVKQWWLDVVGHFDDGVAILDVACGNGALLIPTLEKFTSGRYRGIDLANVSLSAVAKRLSADKPNFDAKLFSEVPAESLPFDDDCFDLASSIFGFEYSDINKSTSEIFRVLKPNGQFQALIHATESVITQMTTRALSEYRDADMASIVKSLNIIEQELARLGNPSLLKSSQEAETARTTINALAEKYMSDLDPQTGNAIMVQFVGDSLKYFKIIKETEPVRRKYLEGLESEFTASRQRYRAMKKAAKSREEIEELVELFRKTGFNSVEASNFYSNSTSKELAAWHLCASK